MLKFVNFHDENRNTQYFIKRSLFAPDLPTLFLPSHYNGRIWMLHVTGWVYKQVARLKIGIIAKEVKRGRLKKIQCI